MESLKHRELVNILYKVVSVRPHIIHGLIESDATTPCNVTRMSEGYIPDLYYSWNDYTIIGEAKTTDDLETSHSDNQYKSYISHLKKKRDAGNKCILIMSVPLYTSITAYNKLRKMIANEPNIKLIICNEIGIYKEYEKNTSE